MSGGVDQGYEAYRQAMADAEADIGEGGKPDGRNSNLRTARFELHMVGKVPAEIGQMILLHFGQFQYRTVTLVTAEEGEVDWSICTWDVEEPSMHGAVVKNLNVRAAELTRHDAYLTWHAVTGFPMLFEEAE